VPLKNKWVVVTRPLHQAKSFRLMLENAEAHTISFPLLEIAPPNDLALAQKKLSNIQQDYDLVIFVSSNAVNQAFKWIKPSDLDSVKVASTGKKTASLLTNLNINTDFCPDVIFNSEALLAIPEFQAFCKDKKVAIIRGEGGRDLLRESLTNIGANVDYIDVYQRIFPQQNIEQLKQYWQRQQLDCVVLTSESSVINFFNLTANETWVNQLTLVLGISRMQGKIPNDFQGKLLIAEDPSDETLFKKLNSVYE
jgi:uroporphyrinogen-III synthase